MSRRQALPLPVSPAIITMVAVRKDCNQAGATTTGTSRAAVSDARLPTAILTASRITEML